MSLSVMGQQKDVKENAYSQVSARIKYIKENDNQSLDSKHHKS